MRYCIWITYLDNSEIDNCIESRVWFLGDWCLIVLLYSTCSNHHISRFTRIYSSTNANNNRQIHIYPFCVFVPDFLLYAKDIHRTQTKHCRGVCRKNAHEIFYSRRRTFYSDGFVISRVTMSVSKEPSVRRWNYSLCQLKFPAPKIYIFLLLSPEWNVALQSWISFEKRNQSYEFGRVSRSYVLEPWLSTCESWPFSWLSWLFLIAHF